MNIVWFVLVGVAAGWLAGQVMKNRSHGLVGDLILGVIGAIIGGSLLGMIGITLGGPVGSLISATFGAVVLIAAVRMIKQA